MQPTSQNTCIRSSISGEADRALQSEGEEEDYIVEGHCCIVLSMRVGGLGAGYSRDMHTQFTRCF